MPSQDVTFCVILKIESQSPKINTSKILSVVTIYPNLKAIHKFIWTYCGHKMKKAIFLHIKFQCDLGNLATVSWYIWDSIHGHHIYLKSLVKYFRLYRGHRVGTDSDRKPKFHKQYSDILEVWQLHCTWTEPYSPLLYCILKKSMFHY